jgi:hypothetical protein
MVSEGEEDVETAKAFIPGVEVALGHGEGVAEVEESVHVGVGEGLEELGLLVGLSDEILMALPDIPGPLLERNQLVSARGVLHITLN